MIINKLIVIMEVIKNESNYAYIMHSIYYLIAPTNKKDLGSVNENEDERLKNLKEIININKVNINKVEGWTSFFSYAIFFRQEKIALYFLEIGADVNYIDSINLSPLNYLCGNLKLGSRNGSEDEVSLIDLKKIFKEKEMHILLSKIIEKNNKVEVFYRRFDTKHNKYEPYFIYQCKNYGYDKIFSILTTFIKTLYENIDLYKHFMVEIGEFDDFNSVIRTDIDGNKKKEILLDYILANDENGAISFLKHNENPKKEIRYLDLDSQTVLHWALYMNYYSEDSKCMLKIIKLILELDCVYLNENEQPIYALESIRGLNSVHIALHFDNLKTNKLNKKYNILFSYLDYCINNINISKKNNLKSENELNFDKIFKTYPVLDKDLLKNESKNIQQELKLMYIEDSRTHEKNEKDLFELLENEENIKNNNILKKSINAEKKAKREAALKANKLEIEQQKIETLNAKNEAMKVKMEALEKEKLKAQEKERIELENAKIEAENAKIEAERTKQQAIEANKLKKAEKKALKKAELEAKKKEESKIIAQQKVDSEIEKVKNEALEAKNEAMIAKNEALLAKKEAQEVKNKIEKMKNDLESESSNSDITDNESCENNNHYEDSIKEKQMYEQQFHMQQMHIQQMYEQQFHMQQMYEQQLYYQNNQPMYIPISSGFTPEGRPLQPTPVIYYS